MIKTLLTTVALVVGFSTASQAAMMSCTNKNIAKMEKAAMAMKAPGQKHDMQMAMEEVHMAAMKKKEGKKHDCQMHLDGAMKMTEHK